MYTLSSFTDGADRSSDERTEQRLILVLHRTAAENCLQPHSRAALTESLRADAKLIQWIINTKARCLKVYLDSVVCEAHDINSAFSVSKFTSKLPQNNEQERGEEGKWRPV